MLDKDKNRTLTPVVYFRSSLAEEYEMEICKTHFSVVTQRSHIGKDKLVIPRYSALPYYKELEVDIEYNGSKLINTYREHCYVADLHNWYWDIEDLTPTTWFRLEDMPNDCGPVVLKGNTNSKKHSWNTHMFAKNREAALEVYSNLINDGLIGDQQIYVREYVPLKTFATGINGLPITEEYRFFILDGKVLTGAFYWSEHVDYLKDEFGFVPAPSSVPKDFLQEVISRTSSSVRFYVVDIAKTKNDGWIVVELNDASMSGLSDNLPQELYYNMGKVLNG